jgi:hypothetical protein
METKIKYSKELLEEICKRDNAKIDYSKIKKYKINIQIEFICKCGKCNTKNFRTITQSGLYCKDCMKINSNDKRKQTWLNKYGVENPSLLKEIIDKMKATCLEKYGNECSLQSKEVKETIFKKYGTENACQSQVVKDKIKNTYQSHKENDNDNTEHHFQTQEFKDKRKEKCLLKHGVEHISQSQEFQDKRQAACLEKYGVISFFKTDEVKEKIKATCLEKFGVENYSQTQEFKEQFKQTCLKKFGVEHPFQLEEFKEKHKQTCLKKYGTEYPMQNAEVAEKQAKSFFKKKLYTFPSGEEINIQGYENYLLDILLKEGYTFNDILTKRTDVPQVWYLEHDKQHRYYCDIYIPKNNTVYEVKSIWTNGRNIDTNKLKKEACLKAGLQYELFVFNKKGIRQVFE